jgi:TonB-linked SusC/RagA family outer membrane protein
MKQKNYKVNWFSRSIKSIFSTFCALLIMTATFGQEKTVTGVVTDKNGVTLPGVNVVIKGTTTGTVTDANGKYSIKVPGPQTVLTFSFVGYVSQDIAVGNQTSINPVLEEEVKELDQVVVIGYGVQKKSDLTGSVASVSGSSFQGIAVTNLNQALQGRATGVNVVSNTGMPGGSVTIQIRGMSSVNGGSPLVVIDGIPGGDLNSLNPSDIESIEILKDAASQAIYGSNGGNGVIIVTTKKGKAGTFQTTVNASYGWQNVANTIDMMNLTDYNRTMAELKLPYSTNLDTMKYHNYNDIIFQKDVPVQNYDFSTGGGSEKSKFYISGAYTGQEGIIRKSNYEKLNFRISSEHQVTKKVRFDENVSFVNTKTEGFEEWMYTNVYYTPIFPALNMPPYLSPYTYNPRTGKDEWTITPSSVSNPMVDIDNRNYWAKNASISGNAGLTINLFKGFSYTPRINGYMGNYDMQNFTPKYYFKADKQNTINRLEKNIQRSFGWVVQNIVTYSGTIANNHNFSIMAGQEAKRNWGYNISGTRLNFKSTLSNMLYLDKSLDDTSNLQVVNGNGYENRMSSYFGRLNYDYKGMVLAQFNIRRDGQSDFGPNYRFGTFKSGSVGFKFSELQSVKDLNIISFGKIRASYGETGQYPRSSWPYLAKILTPYVYSYSFDNSTALIGAGPVQISNPDIHWETVISQGVGLDLGFFKDKLMISVDYFNKKNDGMLNYEDVTYMAGTFQTQSDAEGGSTKPEVNSGSVKNEGAEISLNYKYNKGDFKSSFDLSLTFVNNKITDLATDSVVKGNVHNELQGVTIQKVGHPISEFWGYQIQSVIKKDDPKVYYAKSKKDVFYSLNSKGDTIYLPTALVGDVRWKDNNNDGKIDDKDRTYLGNPNPPFIFSFSINLSYKMFDFSAYFNGVAGNKIFNGAGRYFYDWNKIATNRSAKFAGRYRDPLTDNAGNLILDVNGNPIDPGNESYSLPRLGSQNYGRSSELYIEDGSYLRLKNIQIGFTLPSNISNALKIQKFRVYASLTNVFTITNYSGFDPEVARYDFGDPSILGIDIGGYPQTRVLSIGANLTF